MRFLVTATSARSRNTQPCEGAKRSQDERGNTVWHIEIATLEQLLSFIEENGLIIVDRYPEPCIEIYDTHRE